MESISISNPPVENMAPPATQFNGFYRGRVIEHGKYGACKVWIPEVYPPGWRLDPKKLPYAEQAQSIVAFGAQSAVDPENPDKTLPPTGVAGGVYSYPAIGSYVLCVFLGGSIEHPVYFAAVPSQLPEAKEKWESIELSKTAKGLLFTYHLPKEDSSDEGEMEEVTIEVFTKNVNRGVSVKVLGSDKDANKIRRGEIKIDQNGMTLFTLGAINIEAGTNVNITANSISLNAAEKISEKSESGIISIKAPTIATDVTAKSDGRYEIKYNERFKGKIGSRKVVWTP